ncbi:hypothetical protein [Micromonospora thermarum]|uniref:Uncharacterized protein n=1 Tax=Micromonospora thermarum TaxID=2720024 RepID=A0ABX0ZCL7_9ACTN|nr:hypothetical protein [Micromonospora thermarum]NJP33705.1 hypothetical protein [Micromonospora thermarum]
MSSRMDQIVAAAVRQGFSVRQTRTGAWIFAKGISTLVFTHTPHSPKEWMEMLSALRGAGLRFPVYRRR